MVGAVGGGKGNRLPCVSSGIPVGTRGSESTGITPERGKSTVAHGKNIAFGDGGSYRSDKESVRAPTRTPIGLITGEVRMAHV